MKFLDGMPSMFVVRRDVVMVWTMMQSGNRTARYRPYALMI